MVQPGMIYQHYRKKSRYLVLSLATHSETLEPLVIYIALYDNDMSKVWARPLAMWEELVLDKIGQQVPRFKLIGPAVNTHL